LSTEDGAAVMEVHPYEFLAEETTGDVFPAKDLAVGAARQTEVVYRRGGGPGNGASVELPELLSLRRGEERSEAKQSYELVELGGWGCESSVDIKGGGGSPAAQQ